MNYNGFSGSNKPIVVLFGPTCIGKTAILVRLINYLHDNKGYFYSIDLFFHEYYYKNVPIYEIENRFANLFERPVSEIGGPTIMSMCNIHSRENEIICRFLDSPGECLCPLNNNHNIHNNVPYEFLSDLIGSNNKKIWIFLLDPCFTEDLVGKKLAYIARIKQISQTIGSNDNVIFLVNKYDTVNVKYIEQEGLKGYINCLYDGILDMAPFTVMTKKWYWPFPRKKEHFKIAPFCAFEKQIRHRIDGTVSVDYTLSDNSYPEQLWSIINKAIMNKF